MQKEVAKVFKKHFGRTPLTQRIADIKSEAEELFRYTDYKNLREEAGDLLATTIMLCEECNWDYEVLIKHTLDKIKRRRSQYSSLGRKTKVAIFGGAFDPITTGHMAVAKIVLNYSDFNEVWLTPVYQHMYNKEMTPAKHRINMCKIASLNDGRIKTFDYEIKNKLKGETYQFAKLLLEEQFAKDEYDFSLIIGQDNANDFDKWVNYKELERMMRFVIVPRSGYTKIPKNAWYLKQPHIFLQKETPPECSSTIVREEIKKKGDYSNLVTASLLDAGVQNYIENNRIYL